MRVGTGQDAAVGGQGTCHHFTRPPQLLAGLKSQQMIGPPFAVSDLRLRPSRCRPSDEKKTAVHSMSN